MSIQEKSYTSKKTGKKIVKYYASVFDKNVNKCVWGKGRKTKREAKQDELELIEEIDSGKHIYETVTFKELSDLWLESVKKEYANSTYKTYEGYLSVYILPVFGDENVAKIEPRHIQKFNNEMNKIKSPATSNKALNLISVILGFGKNLVLIKENPCRDIKRSKIGNNKVTTWDEDQIHSFLSFELVKESIYYDMLLLSFTTGMRPGEICGMAENDLIGDNSMTLNRGLDRFNEITDMKTSNSHRKLQISPLIYKRLVERKRQNKIYRFKNGIESKEEDFIFLNEIGNFINPNAYSRAFRSLLAKYNNDCEKGAELPIIRLYDSRHSFATNILSNTDVNVKVVAEVMGNSVTTALTKYAHLKDTMHKNAVLDYTDKLLK